MCILGVGDFLDHRRVDVGGGNGHEAQDVDEHTAVALDADKEPLGARKRATDDAHALALGEVARVGVEVDELLVIGAGDPDEVFHLMGGDGDGLVRLAVHDVADGQLGRPLVLGHLAGRGVDEDEVVHAGHQPLDHDTMALLAAVLHGHKIGDAASVQVLLDLELAVISHANGKPYLFLAPLLDDCPYFHERKGTVFFVILYQLPRFTRYIYKEDFYKLPKC